jgi:hypothetical protein
MAKEKMPTAGNPALNPSTNSVRPDFGKTAREGSVAGDRANAGNKAQLDRQFNDKRPGNSPCKGTDTKGY